jgi:hypothetical protein
MEGKVRVSFKFFWFVFIMSISIGLSSTMAAPVKADEVSGQL